LLLVNDGGSFQIEDASDEHCVDISGVDTTTVYAYLLMPMARTAITQRPSPREEDLSSDVVEHHLRIGPELATGSCATAWHLDDPNCLLCSEGRKA
jgi:hypothetical protein